LNFPVSKDEVTGLIGNIFSHQECGIIVEHIYEVKISEIMTVTLQVNILRRALRKKRES